jgi:hypothetical protein
VDIAHASAVGAYHKQLSAACLEEISPLGLARLVTLIRNILLFQEMHKSFNVEVPMG